MGKTSVLAGYAWVNGSKPGEYDFQPFALKRGFQLARALKDQRRLQRVAIGIDHAGEGYKNVVDLLDPKYRKKQARLAQIIRGIRATMLLSWMRDIIEPIAEEAQLPMKDVEVISRDIAVKSMKASELSGIRKGRAEMQTEASKIAKKDRIENRSAVDMAFVLRSVSKGADDLHVCTQYHSHALSKARIIEKSVITAARIAYVVLGMKQSIDSEFIMPRVHVDWLELHRATFRRLSTSSIEEHLDETRVLDHDFKVPASLRADNSGPATFKWDDMGNAAQVLEPEMFREK